MKYILIYLLIFQISIASDRLTVSVPKHKINYHQIISADDLMLIDVSVKKIKNSSITNASELIGKMAKHNLNAEKIINSGDIALPIAIKKGDIVTLHFEKDGLIITKKAKAMNSGGIGNVINVISGNKVISGIISDSKIVKVI